MDAPRDTLHAPGSLTMPIPESADSGVGYIYVPGTTYRKRIDSGLRIAGSVVLDSLPPGLMPSVDYAKGDTGSRPIVIATDVSVHSPGTTHVNAYAAWPYSAKLALNTSASGVPISRDQEDFPLLVRLTAPAFDFSKAAPGGADLRFAKADGTPLAREIASWDAQAGKADVWVRMDTVHAGSAAQYLTLHWGKADAAAFKARRPVFDTLAGFAGAWHPEEDAADTTANGLYKDITGAGSDADDRIANTSRSGVVGAGHGLDSGDYAEAPKASAGLRLTRAFTLAIWYRSTGKGMGPIGGELISIGDNYGLRLQHDSLIHFWYWPATPPAGSPTAWYEVTVKGATYLDGNWHQIFGTLDAGHLRLYVDGNEVGNATTPDPVGLQCRGLAGKSGAPGYGLLPEAERGPHPHRRLRRAPGGSAQDRRDPGGPLPGNGTGKVAFFQALRPWRRPLYI